MSADGLNDAAIRHILAHTQRIAVVGASNKPDRPSYGVTGFLVARGYDVTPINPGIAGQTMHGCTIAASIADAAPLEMVDIFRAADQIGPVVEDAIRLRASVIWMQLGVINHEAAAQARAAGLVVVMDRCPVIEWSRLAIAT
jgi:predicted CoA-binding protein